jgi:hypothetical protein
MPDGSNVRPSNIDVNSLGQVALKAARAGKHVFPITPGAKTPPLVTAWQTAASKDPAQIEAWWRQWPDANIGWVPALSGETIVDLDCKPGKPNGIEALARIEAEHGTSLPPTWTIATPSGGEHRVFRGSMRTSTSQIAAGIDIRGGEIVNGELASAGYGLLPPSVVAGKPYAWRDYTSALAELPVWFAERIQRAPVEPRSAPQDIKSDLPHVIDRGRRYLRGVIANFGAPVNGSRNADCARHAAKLGDFGISKEWATRLLEEQWAPHGETPDEPIAEIVASAYRSRQNAPGCDYRPADTVEGVERPAPGAAQAEDDEHAEPLVFPQGHRGSALRRMPHAPLRWAWRHRIEYGRPMILPGDKGTGKTTLALGAAVASLGNVLYLGEPMERMPWLVLLGEDTYRRADAMLAGLCRDMNVSEGVLEDIRVLSAVDEAIPGGPTLCRLTASRADPAKVHVEQTEFFLRGIIPLLDGLRGDGPVGLIIDPLDKFVEFDRNNTYVGRALNDRWLEPLCRSRPGLTPWLNDHPSKAGMKDGFGYGGAPGLVNAIPAFLALRKKTDKAGKPIVQEYQGIRQVSLELEVLRVKEAPEVKVDLYRIGDSPLLSLKPADGLTLVAAMARVYETIEKYRAENKRVRLDEHSGSALGPRWIAEALQVDERLARDAMKALCDLDIYENKKAATSGKAPRDPGGLVPGYRHDAWLWTPANLYQEMQHRGKQALVARPDEPIIWQRVELEGPDLW